MKGIFLVSCLVLASIYHTTALKCYDCNPLADYDKCEDVNKGLKPTSVECDPEKKQQCVSINLKSDDSKRNGFSRDCVDATPDVTNFCDYYKEQISEGEELFECVTCESDNCNSGNFQTKRDGDSGSNSLELMLTIIPLFLACILLTR